MARRNPLRSEAEAYRFLLLTIGYFAVIVVASLIATWLGVLVFVVLTLVVMVLWFRAGEREPVERVAPVHRGGDDEVRILVLANETVGGRALRDRLVERAEGVREEVLVVSPILNSALKHWATDDAEARAEAELRLKSSIDRLRDEGVEARGEVGDMDPLTALDDAVRAFGPDEIVISTHPEGRSHWLERGVVEKARGRFAVPITHVVTDLRAERETTLSES